MRQTRFALTSVLVGVAPLFAVACTHAPPAPPTVETHVQNTARTAPAAPAPAASPARTSDDDVQAMLRGDVLHFGFDQAELTDESRQRLQHVAEVMGSHREVTITIAGNTDEHGTEEYNLALGQRRAQVAQRYLLGLGVENVRVHTVSYGKERPAEAGHDEQACAANRRDELAVQHN